MIFLFFIFLIVPFLNTSCQNKRPTPPLNTEQLLQDSKSIDRINVLADELYLLAKENLQLGQPSFFTNKFIEEGHDNFKKFLKDLIYFKNSSLKIIDLSDEASLSTAMLAKFKEAELNLTPADLVNRFFYLQVPLNSSAVLSKINYQMRQIFPRIFMHASLLSTTVPKRLKDAQLQLDDDGLYIGKTKIIQYGTGKNVNGYLSYLGNNNLEMDTVYRRLAVKSGDLVLEATEIDPDKLDVRAKDILTKYINKGGYIEGKEGSYNWNYYMKKHGLTTDDLASYNKAHATIFRDDLPKNLEKLRAKIQSKDILDLSISEDYAAFHKNLKLYKLDFNLSEEDIKAHAKVVHAFRDSEKRYNIFNNNCIQAVAGAVCQIVREDIKSKEFEKQTSKVRFAESMEKVIDKYKLKKGPHTLYIKQKDGSLKEILSDSRWQKGRYAPHIAMGIFAVSITAIIAGTTSTVLYAQDKDSKNLIVQDSKKTLTDSENSSANQHSSNSTLNLSQSNKTSQENILNLYDRDKKRALGLEKELVILLEAKILQNIFAKNQFFGGH